MNSQEIVQLLIFFIFLFRLADCWFLGMWLDHGFCAYIQNMYSSWLSEEINFLHTYK